MCGPACIKIIAAYFGRDISQRRIARACRTSHVSGTTGVNLVRGAQALGFGAGLLTMPDFATSTDGCTETCR